MKKVLYLSFMLFLASGIAEAQMGPPIPLTAAEFASSSAGQSVILAVRVSRFTRTALDAELLERVNDSVYKKTGKRVALYVPIETPFIMGSSSDIKPGAVIFVYAVTTTTAHADVKKVIVVTPYARVE